MSILGSLTGADAAKHGAKKAAKAQLAAMQQAQDTLNATYNSIVPVISQIYQAGLDPIEALQSSNTDLWSPYTNLDQASINQLLMMTQPEYAGQYQAQDPGYQWRLQQGLQGVQNSAVAKRMGMSGNTLAALNNYAQGAASQEFNNSYNRYLQGAQLGYRGRQNVSDTNRLSALTKSQLGQNKYSSLGQLAFNQGNMNAQFQLGQGDVQAAKEAAQAQADQLNSGFLSGLINSGINLAGSLGSAYLGAPTFNFPNLSSLSSSSVSSPSQIGALGYQV